MFHTEFIVNQYIKLHSENIEVIEVFKVLSKPQFSRKPQ
jgi:hypothetical protein